MKRLAMEIGVKGLTSAQREAQIAQQKIAGDKLKSARKMGKILDASVDTYSDTE